MTYNPISPLQRWTAVRKLFSFGTFYYVQHVVSRTFKFKRRLSYKELNELRFWRKEITIYLDWYLGKIPDYWNRPSPKEESDLSGLDLQHNAIIAWANASLDYYVDHLLLPTDYFREKVILDIGCGPIPHAQAFTGCKIYCLDPLVDEYRKLGFPLELHSDRLTFESCFAEKMPFNDDFFDGVISVNAIDHVDDFPAVAREITRVLKPDGVLRFEAHYHAPTTLEPWSLTDGMILENFGHLGVEKVRQRTYTELDPQNPKDDDLLVIWGNR